MSDVDNSVPAGGTDTSSIESDMGDVVSDGADFSDDSGDDIEVESAADIEAAQKAGDITKKEAVALKKKLKLKVDGLEQDFEVPESEEELKKYFQKALAFDKRTKEHSSYKSQVDQVLEMLQKDPEALLEKMGYNVDDMAEKRLSRKIDELQKSPEQIEADKMRRELDDYKKKEKELSERAEKAELEKMKNQQAASIENDISSALDTANSFLPKGDPEVYAMVANYMLLAIKKGYPQVTAKDVIPLVQKKYKENYAKLLRTAPDDLLEELVSKERLTAYRKTQVQSKKNVAAPTKPQIKDTGTKKKVEEKPVERHSFKDVFGIRPK